MSLPYAYAGPLGDARLKQRESDFFVAEKLPFAPAGEGEHLYVLLEKTNLNTRDVAQRIQSAFAIRPQAISYSGLKDKRARTQQWFSLHLPGRVDPDLNEIVDEGIRVLRHARHTRKLRRGMHSHNCFEIVLRDARLDQSQLEARLNDISRFGCPNYFGEQRFGYMGVNLQAARQWFARLNRTPRRLRRREAMWVSAARAELFNQVLAHRVESGSWNTIVRGDVCQFADGNTFFASDDGAELRGRVDDLELHPTGPLWGAGESPVSAMAKSVEDKILAAAPDLCDGLVCSGVKASRRSLRAIAEKLQWSYSANCLSLSFELRPGCFATSVIREIVRYRAD